MRFCFGLVLFIGGVFASGWATPGGVAAAAPTSPVEDPVKADEKKVPTFKNDVMPILTNACANCHGGKRKKAGVDLTSYDAVMKSVKTGEPDKSRLVKSVIGQGAKLMPPKTGLADAQVQILKAWITAGARND